jgi:exodeoxyribonuclease VII large subunit
MPSSGHLYCTLKDEKAQISVVIFRGQLRQLKFEIREGMGIVGLGRLSVYEPRGTYQIILEYAEPKGVGALQLAFEHLKRKLDQEGLFDQSKKSPLPFLPRAITVITSPTGAVLRDILHIINRRFSGMPIDIWPVKVQGYGAAEEIAQAISKANQGKRTDVIVLARGGGSLEDLAAFNSETVARSIFASVIPVVSAVGHETDVTIADFVADMRAPTPSAAAELVVPVKADLRAKCSDLQKRLRHCVQIRVDAKSSEVQRLRRALVHPAKMLQTLNLRLDDFTTRLNRSGRLKVHLEKANVMNLRRCLFSNNPISKVNEYKLLVNRYDGILLKNLRKNISDNKIKLSSALASIDALSPLAVLRRGYSIVRSLPEQRIVMRAQDVQQGDILEVLLSEGVLKVLVDNR